MLDDWLPQVKVVAMFGVNVKTIRAWQRDLGFPKHWYIGRMAFYSAMEVAIWQQKQRKEAPTEAPLRPELKQNKDKSRNRRETTGGTDE